MVLLTVVILTVQLYEQWLFTVCTCPALELNSRPRTDDAFIGLLDNNSSVIHTT